MGSYIRKNVILHKLENDNCIALLFEGYRRNSENLWRAFLPQ